MEKNVFKKEVTEELISRINALNADSKGNWGKMSVGQMLGHCNVTYEMLFTDKHPRPKGLKKWLVKVLIKPMVCGPKPYKKDNPTNPAFKMTSGRDFEVEKNRLIEFLNKTQALGESHFDGKESHSFGPLTITEWNTLFYKHLNHHLTQFGV